jgi:hypothetical protein
MINRSITPDNIIIKCRKPNAQEKYKKQTKDKEQKYL